MKSLFVFDGTIPFQEVLPYFTAGQVVDIFPLTGDWDVIDRLKEAFFAAGRPARFLDAARQVDVSVDTLRARLGFWSEELGNRSVGGHSLREWLMTPGGETSAWWFTLLSEKNPLKTDVFLKIAQLAAVDVLLSSGEYGLCLVASTDKEWGKAVLSAAVRHSVSVRRLNSSGPPGWRARVKTFLQRAGPWGDFVKGIFRLGSFAIRGVRARWAMGPFFKRKRHPRALFFVTYFPAVDRRAAEKGVFRNRFTGPLQELLHRGGRQVNWLLMAAAYEGFGFGAALKMGRVFAKEGEAVYFLEEFFRGRQLLACVRTWARLIRAYWRISRSIEAGFWARELTIPEADPLLSRLWRRSTMGDIGVEGAAFLESFKGAFDFFSDASDCLYFLEMQAWEKALNAARRGRTSALTTGFQHSAFSRNHFSHYQTAGEVSSSGQQGGLPLPDILGCNGEVSRGEFIKQGHTRVRGLEALRHFHLGKSLDGGAAKRKPPVLLLVGSSDKEVMKSLVSMIMRLFPFPKKLDVWIKPHPGGNFEKVLREMGFDVSRELPFTVAHASLEELFKEASVVTAADSSAAVEALGFGCRVILPVMSNVLSMSALNGHEGFYKKVYNPSEFASTVENCVSSEISECDIAEGGRFVSSFWSLDEALPAWRDLLFGARSGSVL